MRNVALYTTSKCNLSCKHCGVGFDTNQPRQELSTVELKKVIEEIAQGGAKTITILGGEATIFRKDLSEILDHAYSCNLKVVINTNLTSYEAISGLLDKPSLHTIIVSLDGATSETHDKIRGKGTFKKTLRNIKQIVQHNRYKAGDLLVTFAFVMTGINSHETSKMLILAKKLGVGQLNIKNVTITGRASLNIEFLALTSEDLLRNYLALLMNWILFDHRIELEILIPPAFSELLNKAFGIYLPTIKHSACGGSDVYSYVDLLGNHLPCPAMSFEENPSKGLKEKDPKLNLLSNSIAETLCSDTFNEFELKRESREYKSQLFPCKFCKYNDQCQPCVAKIFNGEAQEGEVEICRSIYYHGNNYCKEIKEMIWSE